MRQKNTLQEAEKLSEMESPDSLDEYDVESHAEPCRRTSRKATVGPFSCEYCGESFRLYSKLKAHRRFHTGEDSHPCEFCGKVFRYPDRLKLHRRVHTGERPYECKHCGTWRTYWDGSHQYLFNNYKETQTETNVTDQESKTELQTIINNKDNRLLQSIAFME